MALYKLPADGLLGISLAASGGSAGAVLVASIDLFLLRKKDEGFLLRVWPDCAGVEVTLSK